MCGSPSGTEKSKQRARKIFHRWLKALRKLVKLTIYTENTSDLWGLFGWQRTSHRTVCLLVCVYARCQHYMKTVGHKQLCIRWRLSPAAHSYVTISRSKKGGRKVPRSPLFHLGEVGSLRICRFRAMWLFCPKSATQIQAAAAYSLH